jgi:holin-like protein
VVIDLPLLPLVLAFRGRRLGRERAVPAWLIRVAKGLHDHFGLLFVPAGAGVVANIDRLAIEGPVLVVVLLLSTIATIGVTALIAMGLCGLLTAVLLPLLFQERGVN